MNTKDWILLLVPIFCNGLIIFILQRVFEKRQLTKSIKYEYASKLRNNIDMTLELHAKTTRLLNEGNEKNNKTINYTVQQYVNSALDVYYFYIQNKVVFKSFDTNMEHLSNLILRLTKISNQEVVNLEEFSEVFNKIRDELMILKRKCIKLNF